MLSLLGGKGMIVGGMIVVGLIALAIVSRNWSCRAHRPPRPPIQRSYTVESVPDGATIRVATGIRGRRGATVHLAGVQAPCQGEPLFAASQQSLATHAGKTVRVEAPRRRLLLGNEAGVRDQGSEASVFEQRQTNDQLVTELLERGGDVADVQVFGASGFDLAAYQISAGLCSCTPTASDLLKRLETQAKKSRLGMWGK